MTPLPFVRPIFDPLYLVDTNVISAASPPRGAPGGLTRWMEEHSNALFLSVVTVAEIADGIAKAKREGAHRKSAGLTAWFETLLHLYAERLLPFDLAAARIAGALSDFAKGQGHAPGFADLAIAATARVHGLTILSRNLWHFTPLGVPALDPFAAVPPE